MNATLRSMMRLWTGVKKQFLVGYRNFYFSLEGLGAEEAVKPPKATPDMVR